MLLSIPDLLFWSFNLFVSVASFPTAYFIINEKQNLTHFNSTFAKCTHQMQHYHCVIRENGVLSCPHKCWDVQSQISRALLWQKLHHYSRVLDWLLESWAQFLSDCRRQCFFRTCTFLNFNCSTMTVAPGPVHRWSPGGETKKQHVFFCGCYFCTEQAENKT